ncbi:probable methyltransferase-like protein 25 isoform X2 [Anolis carolinensis]|uniref:probable methyltransferase-like protein 25 isoform X2 n=1 Tax=Anolis carolinensis TaxID=28377 RepID=UPI00046280E6
MSVAEASSSGLLEEEPCLLPPEPSAERVAARIRAVARFLRRALPLCLAHTVDFYTRGLWEKMVALPPETVLEALSGDRLRRLLEEAPEQRPLEEPAGCAAVTSNPSHA